MRQMQASNEREPHIGYLYPAGGQQGSVIKITVGGQFIKDANEVYVTGKGVHGSVTRYIGRVKPLNNDQKKELRKRINELQKKQQGPGKKPMPPAAQDANKPADANKPLMKQTDSRRLRCRTIRFCEISKS